MPTTWEESDELCFNVEPWASVPIAPEIVMFPYPGVVLRARPCPQNMPLRNNLDFASPQMRIVLSPDNRLDIHSSKVIPSPNVRTVKLTRTGQPEYSHLPPNLWSSYPE